jgi:hypothetical protein
MVAARRVAKTAAQRWLGDAGTYPILVVCGIASVGCTLHSVRYLTGHPDVSFNKANRANLFKYDAETGANWQSHRRPFATLTRNVVNDAKGL